MKVGAILQARMKSSRLPGKVMREVCGKPVLWHIVERIKRCKTTDLTIVATSINSADDIIVNLCQKNGFNYFRGSEHDVLDRYCQAARHYGIDVVVRFTADNALIDPGVSDETIRHFLDNADRCDFVSNAHPPSYPAGLDTEVVSFPALETAWKEAREPFQREHVLPFIWDQPERFRLGNVVCEHDIWMTERWTMDYPEDYEFIKAVFNGIYPYKPDFGMYDVFRFLDEHPEIRQINRKHAGINWYRLVPDKLRTVERRYIRTESGGNGA